MQTDLLFVYGTLKRGLGNHRVMRDAEGEFLAEVRTEDRLPLVIDGLPYLLDMPGRGHCVEGELYRVTSAEGWARLDRLEGHPRFYRRRVIGVVEENGRRREAWAYFLVRGAERVARGEFAERF
ncbi:MAG: gamma-glutamylcyclotransferase [Chthoniobacterales bacterium]|nr:gamma-glutamylcyclotransferase [Chthoniobacterales bacterium]